MGQKITNDVRVCIYENEADFIRFFVSNAANNHITVDLIDILRDNNLIDKFNKPISFIRILSATAAQIYNSDLELHFVVDRPIKFCIACNRIAGIFNSNQILIARNITQPIGAYLDRDVKHPFRLWPNATMEFMFFFEPTVIKN